ncbi:MAG: glutathione S-transferase family protein [Pseudomonadota bacterium]|nr:glutathione S-transferase family protein [Pseudomonadota bacterium]
MLELYYLEEADSICSNRALMTLAEKGINEWIPRPLVLLDRDQFRPEYLKLNPKAQVPTLVHDGNVIRESSIICDYLDDLRPEPPLKPADPAARAHMREWIKDSDESGYQATASLNFVTKFRLEIPRDQMEERWKKVTDIDRLHRQQSCVLEGLDSPYVLRAIGAWERIFTKMEETLVDGRPWIMGDQFTLIETNSAPFIKVLEMLRILDLWLDGRPNVQRWWDGITMRASYKDLEEYPGQSEDDGAPHAKAGAAVADKIGELLVHYRTTIPHI